MGRQKSTLGANVLKSKEKRRNNRYAQYKSNAISTIETSDLRKSNLDKEYTRQTVLLYHPA